MSKNCPNCGRVISDTANICPSCKTKIFHNKETDPNYNPDGTRKTVKVDGKRLKNKGGAAKTIISIIVIIALVATVLCFVFTDKITEFAVNQKWGWLYWLMQGEKMPSSFFSSLMHFFG